MFLYITSTDGCRELCPLSIQSLIRAIALKKKSPVVVSTCLSNNVSVPFGKKQFSANFANVLKANAALERNVEYRLSSFKLKSLSLSAFDLLVDG